MPLRSRAGKWEWRFQYCSRRYEHTTDWDATTENRTRAEAEEHAFKLALIEGRSPVRPVRPRVFEDAAQEFLRLERSSRAGQESTYKRIATSFASLTEKFGRLVVSSIDEAEVDAYKTWRIETHQVQPVTVRHDLHNLSLFFQFAVRRRYCHANPVAGVDIPSDSDANRMYIVTTAEERQYLRYASADVRDMATLIINQGCRPEELLATAKRQLDARTNWVDLENRKLHILRGKTRGARRTLTLTAESCSVFSNRLSGNSVWFFPTPIARRGKHQRGRDTHELKLNNAHDAALKKMHDKICDCSTPTKGASLQKRRAITKKWRQCPQTPPFVLYDFRHTFATRFAERTKDLPALAAILGHSSLRMVMKYVHPTEQHQAAAMASYEQSRQAERDKISLKN